MDMTRVKDTDAQHQGKHGQHVDTTVLDSGMIPLLLRSMDDGFLSPGTLGTGVIGILTALSAVVGPGAGLKNRLMVALRVYLVVAVGVPH